MGCFSESPTKRKINVISFVWLRVELSLEDALDLREIRADDCVYPDLDHRRNRGRRHLAIDSSYRWHDTEPPARSKGLAGLSISVRHGSDLAGRPRVQTLALLEVQVPDLGRSLPRLLVPPCHAQSPGTDAESCPHVAQP